MSMPPARSEVPFPGTEGRCMKSKPTPPLYGTHPPPARPSRPLLALRLRLSSSPVSSTLIRSPSLDLTRSPGELVWSVRLPAPVLLSYCLAMSLADEPCIVHDDRLLPLPSNRSLSNAMRTDTCTPYLVSFSLRSKSTSSMYHLEVACRAAAPYSIQ